MLPIHIPTILLHLCVAVLYFIVASSQNDVFVYRNSSCTQTFTGRREYQTNLYSLISNFTANSDTQRFYNYTTGEMPNRIYGLFLCNIVVSNQICHDCVTDAIQYLQQNCSSSVEAIIWYTACMVRYANRDIISRNETSPYFVYKHGQASYSRFNQTIIYEIHNLINTITRPISVSMASAMNLIHLEQNIVAALFLGCTPDLIWPLRCRSCLQIGLRRLQVYENYGELYQPSCLVRYAIFDYQSTALPSVSNTKFHIVLGVLSSVVVISLLIIMFLLSRQKRRNSIKKPTGLDEIERMENLHIGFEAIKAATYNFSEANKLGQGGFGVVYMGTLTDGKAVAVKRLSNASGQGIREFKTEACLAAKLQHKNLVKVYGFCLEGVEMLLVYEFVPNKSLDRFLFDVQRRPNLKWEARYKIIEGIARGLLYLHEDSCPKIIHRDLKPSNILLDGEMNPKIADFGMAKLFGGNQTQGNTSRIGGTFGYMAPEYATTGHFSIKSDIFSYGVIVLEIISGLRNHCLNHNVKEENLLNCAWRLWNEGKYLKLADAALGKNFSRDEIRRCIHVGLLCTQADPDKRPSMGSVLIMLNSQINMNLPSPVSPPAFPYEKETLQQVSHGRTRVFLEEAISDLSPR